MKSVFNLIPSAIWKTHGIYQYRLFSCSNVLQFITRFHVFLLNTLTPNNVSTNNNIRRHLHKMSAYYTYTREVNNVIYPIGNLLV